MNQMVFPVRIRDDDQRRARRVQDLLALVMEAPPSLVVIKRWNAGQREQAEDWAGREHLAAADNALRRIQRPYFVDQGARAKPREAVRIPGGGLVPIVVDE